MLSQGGYCCSHAAAEQVLNVTVEGVLYAAAEGVL